MWFDVINGDLNLIFENFHRNIFCSKMIFLTFNNVNVLEQETVLDYIEDVYSCVDNNDKNRLLEISWIGIDEIPIYLYETLLIKLYSEYEYFIKELIEYMYSFDIDKFKRIVFLREKRTNLYFSDYLNEFKSYIDNTEIIELLNYLDDVRIVRNKAVHEESIVYNNENYSKRKRINRITEVYNEMPIYNVFEIKEEEMGLMYCKIEELLYILKDYMISNKEKFRIKI